MPGAIAKATKAAKTNISVPKKIWDVFVSHSSNDKGIATHLAQDLQELGNRVWIDFENLSAGDLLPKDIGEAIRDCTAFIILWSSSTDKSTWVAQELQAALSVGHRILLCLVDETPYDHHPELSDLFWCDFRKSYEFGLAELVRGLENIKSEMSNQTQSAQVNKCPEVLLSNLGIAQAHILKELDNSNFSQASLLQDQLKPTIQKYLKKWPRDPEILSYAGYHYKNAVRISTRDGARKQTTQQKKLLDKAEGLFNLALAAEPGAISALNGLGSISSMRGNMEMAEHYCLRAIQQARHVGTDYSYAIEDLESIRAEKKRRTGKDESKIERTVTINSPLSSDGTSATISYHGIATVIPETQRMALEESLRSFKSYLDLNGLKAEINASLRIEIRSDAPYEAAFFGDTGLMTMKPVWAGDTSVILREYAHHSLFCSAKLTSHRKAGPQIDNAIESGLADYLPCSFMNDPVMGSKGSPVAFNVPFLRQLENQETMSHYDLTSPPQYRGQVWGGAFWQIRQLAGPQIADRIVTQAWLAACRTKGAFDKAFVTSLLNQAKSQRHGTLRQKIVEVLKSRGILTKN